ncbi:MAG: threonine/serine dehydratase [Alphaproteobacteria bacterium]|nr:threonine/serine dehydratase [Alphaproteobacteria bacterium]
MSFDDDLPTFADVEAAAEQLRGVARQTPLLESDLLNERVGGRLLVKAEPLQRTGSFKFRGAYNAISRQDGRPVVAYSSGNHAQGVAFAAKLLGVPATIVMPSDAPEIKQRNTRAYGAVLRLIDRYRDNREDVGAEIAETTGAALIKPYDDPYVIAGQGTVGLELAAQAKEVDAALDAVLICCGGGGLSAGSALALKERHPDLPIYTVEPNSYDSMRRSLEAGERQGIAPGAPSLCDALLAPLPGEMTFSLNQPRLAGGFAVSDDEVLDAMAVAFDTLKLVLEPGGAASLAAALAGRVETRGRTVAVVASGGNVDPAIFTKALERASS